MARADRSSHVFSYDGFNQLVFCSIAKFCFCNYEFFGKRVFTFVFSIVEVHAMEELKLTGNHLKGSRPLLTFSSNFDKDAHWKLLKEMLTQVVTRFIFLDNNVGSLVLDIR